MKQFIVCVLIVQCFFSLSIQAQSEKASWEWRERDSISSEMPPVEVEGDSAYVQQKVSPLFSPIGSQWGLYGIVPFYYHPLSWQLHEGFNASVGLNVTFSPDSYAPSGVGFGQDAAFMYAFPVNNRLSVAAGLYANNMDWGFYNYKNVGFAAVATYRLTDKISIYAYGNKSFMPKRSLYYYPLPNFTPDRIGGMVNFKLGESASISIGVEGIKSDYPWWY